MAVPASCCAGAPAVGGERSSRASNDRLVNVHEGTGWGPQAAPGCITRWPACVEHSMASDPDRHRVVPKPGDDSTQGRARCPRQPSPGTYAPRRSPSSSRCPQRRSAAGPRRACCPTSAPWAATDATPTGRSGPCWKPCPSHPRPASPHASRLPAPPSLLSMASVAVRGSSSARSGSCRTGTRATPSVRERIDRWLWPGELGLGGLLSWTAEGHGCPLLSRRSGRPRPGRGPSAARPVQPANDQQLVDEMALSPQDDRRPWSAPTAT
jgi:hypothetical protein